MDAASRATDKAVTLLTRATAGFSQRLLQSTAKSGASATQLRSPLAGSIFSVFSARLTRSLEAARIPESQQNRWLIISSAGSSSSLSAQTRLISAVSPSGDFAFNAIYTLGAAFTNATFEEIDLRRTSDEDLSILLESVSRVNPSELDALEPGLSEGVSSLSRDLWKALQRIEAAESTDGLNELSNRFGRLVDANRTNTLAGLRASTIGGKRRSIHIFGPDLLSMIQALCDPAMELSWHQLEIGQTMFHGAGLLGLFTNLLIMRLAGPYPSERKFLKENVAAVAANRLPARQISMISDILSGGDRPTPVRPRSHGWGRQLAYILCRISNAQAAFNTRLLIDAILDLFELDPDLVDFLDWNIINEVLSSGVPSPTARTAFVTFLMGRPSIRSRFVDVSLSMGMGAFIGDLSALIDRPGKLDPMMVLMSKIKTLPPKAASHLTSAIVERNVVERLASTSIKQRNWPKELPPIDESKLSIARLDALKFASQRKLLAEDILQKHVEEEVDRLRMNYFESRRLTGRVRVIWTDLAKGTRLLTEADAPILKALSMSSSISSPQHSIVGQLAELLSERLTSFILFDSDNSVDQSISNNLRHGIILPRFLRAFDDAYQTATQRKDLPPWSIDAMSKAFQEDARAIIAFRDSVSDRLKRFLEDGLTFSEGGTFAKDVHNALRSRTLRHFSLESARPSVLGSGLSREAQRLTKIYLANASRILGDSLQKEVSADLRSLRRRIQKRAHPDTIQFLDCLDTNLHEAFAVVRKWIGLTDERANIVPFKAAEVVQLYLLSTALFSVDKLKVESIVTRSDSRQPVKPEPRFEGKYLELFEDIVHNLLSNAFRYSGEELKTKIKFEVHIGSGELVFICINSTSVAAMEKCIENYESTLALSRSKVTEFARKDHDSGFQKMRVAVQKATGRQPRFHIPAPSRRDRTYRVEVRVSTSGMSSLEAK